MRTFMILCSVVSAAYAGSLGYNYEISNGPALGGGLNGGHLGGPSYGGQVLGGLSYGGQALGGPSYGSQVLGGLSYGGQALGGPSYGGQALGGPSYGGQALGGPGFGGSGAAGPSLGSLSPSGPSLGGNGGAGPSLGGLSSSGPSFGGHGGAGPSLGGLSPSGLSLGGNGGAGPSLGGLSSSGPSFGGHGGAGPSLGGLAPAGPSYSAPVELNKEFFTYTAPEHEFNDAGDAGDIANSLKKNLRVIFIKGPENTGLENAALQLAKSAGDERTAIYVLSKQADVGDLANKLQSLNHRNSNKPEVHFVKYRTPADADNAQRAIQSQYDGLGGNTSSHNGGVAPVLDFASKAPAPAAQQYGGSPVGGIENTYLPPNKL